MLKFIAVLLALAVLAPFAPLTAEVVPAAKSSAVVGTDSATGEVVWTIDHLATSLSQKGEPAYPIRGPVSFDGATYYAVRGDVMRVDTEEGVITDRQQYPALISALEVRDGKLIVTLDINRNIEGERQPVEVPYRKGFIPGRGPWESFPMVGLRARSEVPTALLYEDEFEAHTGPWTAEREQLRLAEARDPTNPLLPAFRGLAASLDGDQAAAKSAFAKASAVDAPWNEKLQLCGVLERAKAVDAATAACAAGRDAMLARGIRPEALSGLVLFVVLTGDLTMAMENAVAENDVEGVNRIAESWHTIFPTVESAFMAWHTLAEWFESQGRADLAATWRARGDAAATSPMTRAFWGSARAVDLWLLLLTALFAAFPVAGFAVGLRPRREPPRERRPWLPHFSVAEVAVVGALLLASLPLSMRLLQDIHVIGTLAEAPIAALQDGYGSPDVVAWLDGLPEGANRDTLLGYARHELDAARAGRPVELPAPSPMLVYEIAQELAAEHALRTGMSFSAFVDSQDQGMAIPNALPFVFPAALGFFLLALAGWSVRRSSPKIADFLMWVVPGSCAGPAAALVAVALFAGMLYLLTPMGSILQTIALPAFGKYFGLGGIGGEPSLAAMYPADRIWPWIAAISGLLIHLSTVLVYRARVSR